MPRHLHTILCLLLLAATGCDQKPPTTAATKPPAPAPASSTPPAPTPIPKPTGHITLNQHLFFADDTTSSQGMGFLAQTPSGNLVIVTSAHFLDQDGPRLRSMEWTIFSDGKAHAVARSTTSLGKPGNEGTINQQTIDLSSDYLILVPDGPVADKALGITPLRLDRRETIPTGERIWLPYLDLLEDAAESELFEGAVVESVRGTTLIVLDKPVQLIAASGSPVISQLTGQVIGTVSRGGTDKGKTQILIAPSWSIRKAMREAEAADEHPLLETIVGKDQPPQPVRSAPRGPLDDD